MRQPASSTATLLPVDLAANAASLGACAIRADTLAAFRDALATTAKETRTSVIVVPVDREARVGGYDSWWDVPVAEVSTTREVQAARADVGSCAAKGARLPVIRVANAPCSWGVLEFEAPATHAPAAQVLDEMAAAGYAGTELGDWGFLPTEPAALAADLATPRALARRRASCRSRWRVRTRSTRASTRAVRTARLLADVHAEKGVIVLSDDNTSVPAPHRARRADPRRGRPQR